MAFTNALFHPMLAEAAEVAVEVSLHTGDPGSEGDNEVSGGDYARRTVGWQAPADGAIVADGEIEFAVPALSDEATHIGLWDSSGTYLGAAELAVAQPFPTPGTLIVEPATLSMSG